jgi:hypothetical protein
MSTFWNLMSRIQQSILIVSTILASWLGMQAIHEAGHVLGAWLTGGRVTQVVLSPLTISRTDLDHNPHPLAVVWAGPVFGVLAPLALWLIATAGRASFAFLPRFFAGFCLVANGAYIGVGAFWRIGDCGEMLRTGSAIWQLVLFGAVAMPSGFWLWNGQGPHFGLGAGEGRVSTTATYVALAICLLLLTLGFLVDGR